MTPEAILQAYEQGRTPRAETLKALQVMLDERDQTRRGEDASQPYRIVALLEEQLTATA